MKQKGIVYLVGAGPGDPGLITLKGLACIKEAEVLVYDRLVNKKLLHFAPDHCEKIYVGKKPHHHTFTQDEINQLLAEKALAGKIVVRLKGGDPFVFGRGGEEAEVLAAKGVPFEIVPGITSAVAVPAYAGIPVTYRDYTSSFTVITGHEDPTKKVSALDWEKIAAGGGTLIFLMGVGKLPEIVKKLLVNGRKATTPVAIISRGTRPEQQVVVSTLAEIVEKTATAKVTSPAVIVVGEVVRLREKLAWVEKKPLFGKRILVTRARAQASELSRRIEKLGGEAWEFPLIEIKEPLDFQPLDQALAQIDRYSWLIFTSVNGVDAFFTRLRRHKKDARALHGLKICAVGPKTKERLTEMCLDVDYMPNEYRAEAIAAGLQGKIQPGQWVLLPQGDLARPVLANALQKMGAKVDKVTVYRTVCTGEKAGLLREMLAAGKIHYLTFTSSSAVRNFVETIGPEKIKALLSGVKLISIGPVTSATARSLGLPVDLEAKEYTIDGIMKVLIADVEKHS
ncbi:MAG: uroporphyrinogen-III C-methyltransferase [Firmicutes bacterium]|nr:uroporphyrinogen-III C-methyltransferase [Bacillota bacterium]